MAGLRPSQGAIEELDLVEGYGWPRATMPAALCGGGGGQAGVSGSLRAVGANSAAEEPEGGHLAKDKVATNHRTQQRMCTENHVSCLLSLSLSLLCHD